jgi:predicted transcriptional regulator
MIKLIKRSTDNRYLKSAEDDLWVENIAEAFEMTYAECEDAKNALKNSYASDQLKEIVNVAKSKPMTKKEAKELRNLLKNSK